ncbi:minor capsid protein [Bacillus sp. BRMEA1]|uniref:phage head morphogenesis protein n=1 Tax=Neobacillus endophyticus TaxID=2738405 RepID=UPI0015647340|nr:minor capsid protein [Neobacillus endophyticus]NRD80293.1 minor capsid protein [Neobacillus endophyticus]
MGKFANGIRNILTTFINWLPEGANKSNNHTDHGNVSKTSPTLFDYDVFRLNWEKVYLLQDIDQMMKADTRLKRANHVFARTTVRRGLSVKVSSVVSEKLEQIAQEILDDFLKRVQLNSKLLPWTRSLLKDGELYLNPIIDLSKMRIQDVKNLPAITMQRNEDITGRFTDIKDAFRQIDPISREILTHFPLYSINHIRHDHEAGQLYGNSKYMTCLSFWKKLTMTEEDLVVRRRTRAVPRRLHSVGTKDNPGEWSDVKTYKEENKLDNPKVAAATTDFFGNGLTDIKDLNGDAHLDHIKDVEHLQEIYMIGTGVPLHLLGFGKNVNRDIVEDQKKQFEEDTQELRDLLEYGDDSPFSGLRALFELELNLNGIDPSLVDLNFLWSENGEDTVDKKVDRMIKLRSSQPDPLVSRRFALEYMGRDIGLENQEAIDAEIEAIKEEMDEAKKEQAIEATAINPVKPTTTNTNRSTMTGPGKATTDSKTKANPLHSKKIGQIEKSLANDIRSFFKAVFKQMKKDGLEAKLKEIEKLRPIHDSVTPIYLNELTIALEHKDEGCTCSHCLTDDKKKVNIHTLVDQKILKAFDEAWRTVEDDNTYSFQNSIINAYNAAGLFAFAEAAKQPGVGISFDFVHSGVKEDLEQNAGTRIKGIEETTRQMLGKQLSEAYTNGESTSQMMERIQSVMDIPDWRAEMISRTEISMAYNQSSLDAYTQAGVTQVRYMAVMDNRTCPKCASNNDKVFNIADAPAVPSHPNCRCTISSAD